LIDVIVPAYRGLEETRRCIESVLASRGRTPFALVVIDDASPEPELSAWLAGQAAAGRFQLVVHRENRGFVASVNEGMALHPDRDVVLLNSDTEVAPGWLDRLAACAARDAKAGTLTPFSNNATICSYPDPARGGPMPPGTDVAGLDRAFAEANAGASVEIPTAVGFCMFIRRACLAAVGPFDEAAFGKGYGEEVDFCLRAARAGWRNLLCADVFVYHAGEVSFGGGSQDMKERAQRIVDERYPEFMPSVRDWFARDPAASLRRRAAVRIASIEAVARAGLPPDLASPQAAPVVAVLALAGERDEARRTLARLAAAALMPAAEAVVVEAGEPPDFGRGLRALAARHPGRDLVIARTGIEAPVAWDARLRKAAHAVPEAAVAAPLCESGPAFALGPLPEGTPADLVDRLAWCLGDRAIYEVPVLPSALAWLRRDALENAWPPSPPSPSAAPTPTDLARQLAASVRAAGRSVVLCDYLHVAGASPEETGGDPVERSALSQHHPLGALRRAVADLLSRETPEVAMPALDGRPVILHLLHYWGGGLDKWVRDFARADPSAIHLTLATYRIGESGGQRVVLHADPEGRVPIRTWDLARPIRSTAAGSLEYRRVLEQVTDQFAVDRIVVSSLIGHALDALATPLPTVIVLHDFHPVCRAVNPRFEGTCTRCTRDNLARCIESNPLNRIFEVPGADDWHRMRTRFTDLVLERAIPIVVPSEWMVGTLRALDPRLASASIRVIGHGIDFRPPRLAWKAPAAGERLRLVVPGRLSAQKGMDLLRAAAPGLKPLADVTLVGGGGNGAKLAAECGFGIVESYREDELPSILAGLAPHAAVLASVVPETFSYTLGEMLALGIPPLATDHGAFASRIRHGENGFLFAPDADSLVALVRVLKDEPDRLPALAAALAARPPEPSASDMVAAYRDVLPLEGHAPARFTVGVGNQTGLTEPYRHLGEAYARLQGAYDSVRAAYDHTRAEWEREKAARESLEALWEATAAEVAQLRPGRFPWNAAAAARRVAESREKMRASGTGGPTPPEASRPKKPTE